MLGLSNYASSDEEEEKRPRIAQPTGRGGGVSEDRTQAQARIIDALPAMRSYPSNPNDSQWAALQKPAVDALKADLWSPQTSLQYSSAPVAHATAYPVAVAVAVPVTDPMPTLFRPPNVYPLRAQRLYEYEGGFKEVVAGPGRILFEDGGHFVGSIYKKLRHGNGAMVYADGNIYVGKWDMDKRHGDGGMTTWDGTIIYSGKWKDDQPR